MATARIDVQQYKHSCSHRDYPSGARQKDLHVQNKNLTSFLQLHSEHACHHSHMCQCNDACIVLAKCNCLRRKGVACVPDQLVCSCDRPPEQVVILHGEVCNPAIELSNVEDSEEVCSVKERGIGRQAG